MALQGARKHVVLIVEEKAVVIRQGIRGCPQEVAVDMRWQEELFQPDDTPDEAIAKFLAGGLLAFGSFHANASNK